MDGTGDTSVTLALETATSTCSVAVADRDGRILAEIVSSAGPAHTRRLLPDAHHALGMAGATTADIVAVVVGMGPGTFTGLRIGMATARALTLASGARLVGVPSLVALGWALAEADASGSAPAYIALIDGKRREVFAACFEPAGSVDDAERERAPGQLLRPADGQVPTAVAADDLTSFLGAFPDAVVGGDGAHLYAERLPPTAHLARTIGAPTASMALRAWRAGVPGVVEGQADVMPVYGREPDAARWTARRRSAGPSPRTDTR